ncbi:hypothetical protein PQX77_002127 [Marasmius sp. AFHP31]|nr:hypothetical protein PQX77_002127 [Marasmius sp. AFHP31]
MPTNSTYRSFADLDCDPRQKAPPSPPLFPITIFRRSKARNLSSSYIKVGARIEQAKRTPTMPIRMFPTEKTTFNIFNFGHDNDDRHGMWVRGGHYTQTTLGNTTTHTEAMEPNLGDGEVWDDDDLANKNVTSVQCLSASHNTRLEIHALGIGSGVSTQIRQDIALAGNGVCLSPVEAEDISVSCIRLPAAG